MAQEHKIPMDPMGGSPTRLKPAEGSGTHKHKAGDREDTTGRRVTATQDRGLLTHGRSCRGRPQAGPAPHDAEDGEGGEGAWLSEGQLWPCARPHHLSGAKGKNRKPAQQRPRLPAAVPHDGCGNGMCLNLHLQPGKTSDPQLAWPAARYRPLPGRHEACKGSLGGSLSGLVAVVMTMKMAVPTGLPLSSSQEGNSSPLLVLHGPSPAPVSTAMETRRCCSERAEPSLPRQLQSVPPARPSPTGPRPAPVCPGSSGFLLASSLAKGPAQEPTLSVPVPLRSVDRGLPAPAPPGHPPAA
ncbi:uncharacterized protein LOC128625840 [Artibeus jamaicensis]|uniref:uncharacterized protein LOC128625840 n=1 Tax=Artibeus jamaicensis TaxID=9417 RepID=UPI00235AE21F|nr:uncharacterized protein LOC128625840 [Artibeus jamaicensis]